MSTQFSVDIVKMLAHCFALISLMSAPAVVKVNSVTDNTDSDDAPAKAFSDPVSTMAPTASSSSAVFMASLSSANSGEESALRALGLLRVMSATPGAGRAVVMNSYELDMRRTLPMIRGTVACRKERVSEREIRREDITKKIGSLTVGSETGTGNYFPAPVQSNLLSGSITGNLRGAMMIFSLSHWTATVHCIFQSIN